MDLVQPISPTGVLWVSYLLLVAIAVFAAVLAPWGKVAGDSAAQNVYFGAIVVLIMIWLIRADLPTGLNFHLLGATAMCLLFEWQFALFAMAVVIAAHGWLGGIPLQNFALNWLTLGAFPVLFSRVMLYLVQRYMPHNFYIYIFINTFFVAGISAYLAGAISAAWLYLVLDYSSHLIFDQYLPVLILMVLPEAVCTGMLMTIFVVYKPAWVATFHDSWYLKNR